MTYSTMIFEPLAKLDIKTRNLWCNLTWTLMCLLIYFVLLNKLLLKNANLDDIKSKAWKNANNRTPKIRHDQNGFARTKNWTTFEYLITVFENHRKSRMQHCERSELYLHFKWTKVDQKCQNSQFWRVFENLKLEVKQCYQT